MEKKLITYVILGILVWAILGTLVAGYFFVQYETYQEEYKNLAEQLDSISLRVNVLLSYGNSTKAWHNNTVLPIGATSFNATYVIADKINYTSYGELGILVNSINGVSNNATRGWFYWYWHPEYSRWVLPDYSSAKHILHDGDTIAFSYAGYAEWPPQPPTHKE